MEPVQLFWWCAAASLPEGPVSSEPPVSAEQSEKKSHKQSSVSDTRCSKLGTARSRRRYEVETKLIIYPQLSKCVFRDINKGCDACVPQGQEEDSSTVWERPEIFQRAPRGPQQCVIVWVGVKVGHVGSDGCAEKCLLSFYIIFSFYLFILFKLPTVTVLSHWPLLWRHWKHMSLTFKGTGRIEISEIPNNGQPI